MKMELANYSGPCSCGDAHSLATKEIIIERGAVRCLGPLVESLGLEGAGCLVCDRNTEPYARLVQEQLPGRLHGEQPLAVLEPEGLHADEKAVALLEAVLPGGTGWLVAVGSGTIHDTTRYVASSRGIPFLSFPTAASVDGFVSTVSAMTWYGFKKTLPGIAPLAVVADSNIFSKAPHRLTASGVGDVLGKYTSLLDWQAASILNGEGFCREIFELTTRAADAVMENLEGIAAGEADSCEALMHALLLSGIAMQMWGNSRPASGAEHHLSHLWEMEVINPHVDAYHGEKVGVGLLIALEVYEKLAAIPPDSLDRQGYAGMPTALLQSVFGELGSAVLEENTPDLLEELDPDTLAERFGQVQERIRLLPSLDRMRMAMKGAGCKTTMEELGLDPALRRRSIELSPFVRRRLTLLRLSKLLPPGTADEP